MTGAGFEDGWTDPRWCDASWAAALFAVDPVGTGVSLRALAGPVRARWLALLRGLLPAGPLRTIPLNVPDARLLGGLDLAATLQAGRPVAECGILAEADGGVVLLAMAERLPSGAAARIAAVIDQGTVMVARDSPVQRHAARVGVVALDEGMAEDERAPAALRDRLAFHVELSDIGARVIDGPLPGPAQVAAARRAVPGRGGAGRHVGPGAVVGAAGRVRGGGAGWARRGAGRGRGAGVPVGAGPACDRAAGG